MKFRGSRGILKTQTRSHPKVLREEAARQREQQAAFFSVRVRVEPVTTQCLSVECMVDGVKVYG